MYSRLHLKAWVAGLQKSVSILSAIPGHLDRCYLRYTSLYPPPCQAWIQRWSRSPGKLAKACRGMTRSCYFFGVILSCILFPMLVYTSGRSWPPENSSIHRYWILAWLLQSRVCKKERDLMPISIDERHLRVRGQLRGSAQ